MKILFFISSFPSLSETFILNQITGFIDLGYDVEILAFTEIQTGQIHPDVKKYKLMDKVTFISLPKSKIQRLLKSIGIFLKIFLTNPKKALGLVDFIDNGKFVFSFRPLVISQYFEGKDDIQAIISHYGYNTLTLEIIKNQHKDFPRIYGFFHGNDITGFVQRFGEGVYKPLKQTTSTMSLPISELMMEKLKKMNILVNNVKIHHMGVNMNKFPIGTNRNFENSSKLLLIGRLTEKKGVDVAIKAVFILKNIGIDVQLTVIGEGENRKALEKLISDLNLNKQIELLGARNQSTVKLYLQESDIVILPSKTASTGDQEGVPVSLMEALSCGKLVISTYHSGIPELIQNAINGWLVPENDEEALANKIEDVIKLSLECKNEISKNAVKMIEQSFNIDKLNIELSELINSN